MEEVGGVRETDCVGVVVVVVVGEKENMSRDTVLTEGTGTDDVAAAAAGGGGGGGGGDVGGGVGEEGGGD